MKCEHIKALDGFLKANSLRIGGCGCCSSPWVVCEVCDTTVDNYGSDDEE